MKAEILGEGRRGENRFGGQAGSVDERKGGMAGGACEKGPSELGWGLGSGVKAVWVAWESPAAETKLGSQCSPS